MESRILTMERLGDFCRYLYREEKTEDHQLRVTCLPPLTEVCGM